MAVIARERYHHKEHEGHEVQERNLLCEILRGLRVLSGRPILYHVTGAGGLAEQ